MNPVKWKCNANLMIVEPESLQFSIYTKQQILDLSVKKITTFLTFDALGHPLPGGLYDPALGPYSERSMAICSTCMANFYNCPGHFGHIELPVPVVNPFFYTTLKDILHITCLECGTMQIPDVQKRAFQLQFKLLEAGLISEFQELDSALKSATAESFDFETISDSPAVKIIEKYTKMIEHLDPNEIVTNRNIKLLKTQFIKEFLKNLSLAKTCINQNCLRTRPKLKMIYRKFTTIGSNGTKTLMPDELRSIMRNIYERERQMLSLCYPIFRTDDKPADGSGNACTTYPTDVMFVDVLLVTPPIARPCGMVNDMITEDPKTAIYKAILQTCLLVRTVFKVYQNKDAFKDIPEENRQVYNQIRGDSSIEKFHNAWVELQGHVDHVLNRDLRKTNNVNTKGVKQIIERKAGMIRKHMMGKRVNFACRSVITPDPHLNIDEIGIPDAFAKKLTYPVRVTPWNAKFLADLVLNGPNEYPGAVMIERGDGSVRLLPDAIKVRRGIANSLLMPDEKRGNSGQQGVKTVHRHLMTGDVMLLNRQPTLHKPSIMAHTVRVLKNERTIRMHYANCKSYNADFDGDEMNAHFPQNELGRSEAYNIVTVQNQYLVPKDGTPLSGLIQDHMIAGVKLSMRGSTFTRVDYHHLVWSALAQLSIARIVTLPPHIVKPICLWSGKQIFSTIILNVIPRDKQPVTLLSSAKIDAKMWQTDTPRNWRAGGSPFKHPNTMTEAEVIIRNGELLCGILDKQHYGATLYGLIHCVYELYGGEYSCQLLSAFSKLFTAFLHLEGFTLGVQDILLTKNADNDRRKVVIKSRSSGRGAAMKAVGADDSVTDDELKMEIEKSYMENEKFRAIIDREYKDVLNKTTNQINRICIPDGLITRFMNNNLQLMIKSGAKGSMVNSMQISCLLGQIELEGKRPPLMKSGRSLPSFVPFEMSPRAGGFIDGRFMTGIKPQEFFFHCMAGREGLIDTAVKTSRSGYLQRCLIKHLEDLYVNYDMTVRCSDHRVIQFAYGDDGFDIGKSQFMNKKNVRFLAQNANAIVSAIEKEMCEECDDSDKQTVKARAMVKKWRRRNGVDGENFIRDKRRRIAWNQNLNVPYGKQSNRCPDPVASKFQPDHHVGVLNERLECLMREHFKHDPVLETMWKVKAMQSYCAPGEPVGLLAAQSIGEPSTQMTLNTFHFAGRGDMNVTLGIPRLREILMTASANIKTPSMEIPFLPHIKKDDEVAEKLRRKLTRVTTQDVLEKVHVRTYFDAGERQQNYIVRFHFLPKHCYSSKFYTRPKFILKHMQTTFFTELFRALKKASKEKQDVVNVEESSKARSGNKGRRNDSDDEDDNNTKSDKKIGSDNDGSESEDDDRDTEAADTRNNALDDQEPVEDDEKQQSDDDLNDNDDDDKPTSPNNDESIRKKGKDSDSEDDAANYDSEMAQDITKRHTFASNYVQDKKRKRWCELTFSLPHTYNKVDFRGVLKDVASKSVIWQTPLIRRAFIYETNGQVLLKTDGINIHEMFKYDKILDLNKMYSNDIHAMARTYGIEAATKVILREVRDVFNVYGITIDYRHLSLIADYMTSDGVFMPMNRTGLQASASPLQQMSFEASLSFLRTAIIDCEKDDLTSPSASLMVGNPIRCGTGAFSLVNSQQL